MWFEKLNFEINPFEDTENTRLIGYTDLIEEIFYRIDSSNILFLQGKRGSGKTALLKTAINKYKGNGRVAYIDCNYTGDPNIEKVVLKQRSAWDRFFKKTPRSMILLIDDVHLLSQKNNERLKYFYDQNYIKSIVFTSTNYDAVSFTDSLRERISKVTGIKDLTEDDAIEIIESRLPGTKLFTEEIIKDVFKRTEGNLKRFIKMSEELCKFAVERNIETITNELVNEAFEGKKEELVGEEVEEIKEQKKEETKKETKKKKEEKSKKKESEEEPIKIVYDDIAEKYY